ncbi:MAG: hypothetical protein KAQ91_06490 [Methylococcales bacterium]|nr:hypothetical protein [Methylococcales bacterium]
MKKPGIFTITLITVIAVWGYFKTDSNQPDIIIEKLVLIRRNIELPLREHSISKQSELNDIMQQVLQDVGLWEEVKDRLDSPAQALSGG